MTDGKTDTGARLRSLRENLGLTQPAAAARFGVSMRAYQDYESGARLPNPEFLAKLGSKGVDLTWLLTGSGSMWMSGADSTGDGQMRRHSPLGQFGPIDEHLLELVIENVEEAMARRHLTLAPTKKAQLIAALYELVANEEDGRREIDRVTVERLLKLAG